jgi:hypothetical protein
MSARRYPRGDVRGRSDGRFPGSQWGSQRPHTSMDACGRLWTLSPGEPVTYGRVWTPVDVRRPHDAQGVGGSIPSRPTKTPGERRCTDSGGWPLVELGEPMGVPLGTPNGQFVCRDPSNHRGLNGDDLKILVAQLADLMLL